MELYAVHYANEFKYADYRTIYHNDERTVLVPGFVFLYYVAKIGKQVVLFDTGFRSKETAKGFGTHLLDVEEEVLALTGGRADIIFITHEHFDHVENLELYQGAEIIVSKDAWKEIQKAYPRVTSQLMQTSKIQIVEDVFEVQGSFCFKVIGGHTKGSSVIYFREGEEKFVISGDETYLLDNFERQIPNGNVYSLEKNWEFIKQVHKEGIIPLPSHDSSVIEKYTRISQHIVRII
ncbi:hydroxyacylglutathione hydrolase [Ruminiclostridium hungatei]|uniref:Hydroxyacylglutathione hydrolase n=1 Tax=Ruminiclostridium hungatei TaxID=48256 RepID=A0A1V4SFX9_RUMHU|nr:MBL fold metallo-hydrolase [Ruminiclostridium hungatei]OPX42643.1 hydroxyacylglutathione hydrolase [Ruminiclostridium hungatei]